MLRLADGMRIVRSATSTTSSACGRFWSEAIRLATFSSPACAVTRPAPMLLPRKMSAKLGAITAAKPKSCRAQTACSRDEPQPKLAPAMRIFASAAARVFRTKPGSARHASNSPPRDPGRGKARGGASGLGPRFTPGWAAPHEPPAAGLSLPALEPSGRAPRAGGAAVGARADEDDLDRDVPDRRSWRQPHVVERP